MKKFYTLFIVLFGSILFGQEYRPMLQSDNIWEAIRVQSDGHGDESTDYYQYRLSDQSIIFNEKEYIAVESRTTPQLNGEWGEWSSAFFYLHENISEKKVYVYYDSESYEWHDPGEYLLYDFNLDVGDAIPIDGFHFYFMEIKITEISYQSVFGLENVKTFHTDAYSEDGALKIYEGIGTSTGIITLGEYFEFYWLLTDFSNSLGLTEQSKIQTKIYPNPFSDKIQIQNSEEIKELQLFDLQGKLISTTQNLDELNSKLSSLNNAVYFLKIQFKNNQSETIKLIKNK